MHEFVRNLIFKNKMLISALQNATATILGMPIAINIMSATGESVPLIAPEQMSMQQFPQTPATNIQPGPASQVPNPNNFQQNLVNQHQESTAEALYAEVQTTDEINLPEPDLTALMNEASISPFAPLVENNEFSNEYNNEQPNQDDSNSAIGNLFDSYYDEPVVISKHPKKPKQSFSPEAAVEIIDENNDDLKIETNNLNPTYTFDTFVAGNTNRIAYAAALNVAKHPAQNYNPLFIYGDSGLGKTHLMHAIGNAILKNSPEKKVLCISSEKFMNDLITAIQKKRNEYFREKYRSVDVLLVDDIQFLQSKQSTQTEFFHTFNTLQNSKKQIVLTSDIMPSNMKGIEKRLQTRFEGGYIVTIDAPDLETRIAILRSKAYSEMNHPTKDTYENQGRVLSVNEMNIIINTIASNVQNNIRTLEGSFTKVINTACLLKTPITTSFVFNLIKDVIDITQKRQLDIEMIQECITKYFKIKMEDLLSSSRKQHISYPRQIAMYLCRELLNTSYPSIAEAFAKKDHTTVIHAYEKISAEIKKKPKTQRYVEELKAELAKACG